MEEKIVKGKERIESKKSMQLILMENAEVEATFIAEDDEVEVEIFHKGKNSRSEVVLKGLSRKKTRLKGKLVVEKGAEWSKGNLGIKGLSDGGKIEVVPAIEVYEKNASVEHSASIQETDEEMLFYLQSRGIGKNKAKKMIIESFLNYL
ncbi:MAG: SufD family Fe-S cluster assembly protein [Candidatus Micrarchaeia archaeon]